MISEAARQVWGLDVTLLSLSQAAEAIFQLSLMAAFTRNVAAPKNVEWAAPKT